MIQVDNIEVFNIEGAIRGMRNPLNSWDKSDSHWTTFDDYEEKSLFLNYPSYTIGPNDLKLAQKLVMAGIDHSKFMRQIFITMDITAPIYWWKECSTYKVATVANSTSTMHTLTSKPITKDMFSFDEEVVANWIIPKLEKVRQIYVQTQEKSYWRALIQLLPESFNQMRTWTANYQTLRNIYFARRNHKLQEWLDFCKVIEDLPYAKELICLE